VRSQKAVISIAGPDKLPAIKAALAARAFNIFVTDQHSAEQVLSGS